MMTLMAIGIQPGQSYESREKPIHAKITVCVQATVQTTSAEGIASRIFSGIGVRIDWRHGQKCPGDAVTVTLTGDTPDSVLPEALACALPYEGSHIRVFYDRLNDPRYFPKLIVPTLLGHVMAHEIGHILQGTSQHSETGMMKAKWTAVDFAAMTFEPLRFTQADIDLIESGLAKRSAAVHRGAN